MYDEPEFCEGFVQGVLISKEGVNKEFQGASQLVLNAINQKGGLPLLSEHHKGCSIGRIYNAYLNSDGDICCEGKLDRPHILGDTGRQIYQNVKNKNYKDFSVGFKRDNHLKTLKFLEVSITESGKHRKTQNAKDIVCTYDMSEQQQQPSAEEKKTEQPTIETKENNNQSTANLEMLTKDEQARIASTFNAEQQKFFQAMYHQHQNEKNSIYIEQNKIKFEQAQKDVVGTSLEKNKKFLDRMSQHAMNNGFADEFESDLERVKEAKTSLEREEKYNKMMAQYKSQEENMRKQPEMVECSDNKRSAPIWKAAGDMPKPSNQISNETFENTLNKFLYGKINAKSVDLVQCSNMMEKVRKSAGVQEVLDYLDKFSQDELAVGEMCQKINWTDQRLKYNNDLNRKVIFLK